jgi:hypothetical protein
MSLPPENVFFVAVCALCYLAVEEKKVIKNVFTCFSSLGGVFFSETFPFRAPRKQTRKTV